MDETSCPEFIINTTEKVCQGRNLVVGLHYSNPMPDKNGHVYHEKILDLEKEVNRKFD